MEYVLGPTTSATETLPLQAFPCQGQEDPLSSGILVNLARTLSKLDKSQADKTTKSVAQYLSTERACFLMAAGKKFKGEA